MENKPLYYLGCIIGGGLLFFCPIIEKLASINLNIGIIDWASVGSLILGSTLLIDYYSYHADAEQYKNWWKEIAGYFFVLLFVSSSVPLSEKISAILNILLYIGFLLALFIRYNQQSSRY